VVEQLLGRGATHQRGDSARSLSAGRDSHYSQSGGVAPFSSSCCTTSKCPLAPALYTALLPHYSQMLTPSLQLPAAPSLQAPGFLPRGRDKGSEKDTARCRMEGEW
jgi:hypothetical protein